MSLTEKPLNVAQQLLSSLNVFGALLRPDTGHALPTPPKRERFRKGEDGKRKPGHYAKGLTNWRNGKPSQGRI